MAIYEKPIWGLIKDALADLPEIFTTDDVLNWFRAKYPKIKESSIRAHIVGMSANNPTRRYYSGTLDHGVIYKLDRNRYTRYDPEHHGTFNKYGKQEGISDGNGQDELPAELLSEYAGEEPSPEQVEFALEQHLEEFMERNWNRIDFGAPLDIWVDTDGVSGRQYPTDNIGYIDFLCKDRDTGSFVVVELKKGRTSDVVIGQTQRYMGWVKKHVETQARPVMGLIIASDLDEKLRYALEVAPQIKLRLYRVNFELIAPEESNG